MTKALQLRKIIQDKLYPEGVKLEFGCEVITKEKSSIGKIRLIIIKEDRDIQYLGDSPYYITDCAYWNGNNIGKKIRVNKVIIDKILGKPTTVQEVLLILSGAIGVYISMGLEDKLVIDNRKIRCVLDLTKSVENQEDKVLDSLIELVK